MTIFVTSGLAETFFKRKLEPNEQRDRLTVLYLHICVCVCVCVYIYIYIHTHKHTHTFEYWFGVLMIDQGEIFEMKMLNSTQNIQRTLRNWPKQRKQ